MGINDENFADRLAYGASKEEYILNLLNENPVNVDGRCVVRWEKSSPEEDMRYKIDAWAFAENGKKVDVQIKYRQSGNDVGVAIIRPFENVEALREQHRTGKIPWDRDAVGNAYLYVALTEHCLVVVPTDRIKLIYTRLLNDMIAGEGEITDTSFRNNLYGAELRFVVDSGEGYSYNQKKIICYITPYLIETLGGYVKVIS